MSAFFMVPDVPDAQLSGKLTGDVFYPTPTGDGKFVNTQKHVSMPVSLSVVASCSTNRDCESVRRDILELGVHLFGIEPLPALGAMAAGILYLWVSRLRA
jgi:hypothetical protein